MYDYMGRRVKKSLSSYNGTDWSETSITLFVYDGWNLIQELDGTQTTPTVQKSYAWGLDLSQSLQGAGGVGGLLAMTDGTSTYLYCYDGNGNVGQMIDTSGSLVANYQYDPFGKMIYSDGLLKDNNPFGFSTKYADPETGLYYYGYRYYSSELGRWLRRDPIGGIGEFDLYLFNLNNAIGHIDVLGLKRRDRLPPNYDWRYGNPYYNRLGQSMKLSMTKPSSGKSIQWSLIKNFMALPAF